MTQQSETAGVELPPLVVTRLFPAPPSLVFRAWSSAEHMKRWFSPHGCSVPDAEIDFRPGGVCAICMRLPDGSESWARGHFIEIEEPARLVITFDVSIAGAVRFTALTAVTFEARDGGTWLTVRQDYEMHDPDFIGAPRGSAEGWRTTLDKLEQEVGRLRQAPATPVAHGAFTLRRTYDAAPASVFHALTNLEAKARWFHGGEGYTAVERSMDVRPGGRERARGKLSSGATTLFEAVYFDVVENQRLIYTYDMYLNGRKISVSLATMQLSPAGQGTELVVTEQGAFLDGYEDQGSRERGTKDLLERLNTSLKQHARPASEAQKE